MEGCDYMVRGGKREGAGRKPISEEDSKAMERMLIRLPKDLKEEILELGVGENVSEKARYILKKGIEAIKVEEKEE